MVPGGTETSGTVALLELPVTPPMLLEFEAPQLKLVPSIVPVWEEPGWVAMAVPVVSRLVLTASGFTFPSFLGAFILRVFLVRLDFLAGNVFLPSLKFSSRAVRFL
jgi:hypothetical protein